MGGFSAAGTERLVRIEQMNAAKYRELLNKTFSRVHETLNWGDSSPFSRTIHTNPKHTVNVGVAVSA